MKRSICFPKRKPVSFYTRSTTAMALAPIEHTYLPSSNAFGHFLAALFFMIYIIFVIGHMAGYET